MSATIPAAQYLRMSTEHQRYSMANQTATILAYAARVGFLVTRTYRDAGKSGLVVNRRDGLRQLLQDVVSGEAEYKAILVYDVSRWGRFQDTDEAAHYEFLCRAAGVEVHYCAEQFANDNSLPNSMMKALKRIMAGEYSRELSVKVYEGTKRIALCGFRTGGAPGYGLRRMLVSADREYKHTLANGERKCLQSDRVILVPGPDHEVRCVREIFRMFVHEDKWPSAIAGVLRRNGVAYTGIKRTAWYAGAVNRLLKNAKYCGCSVFGRAQKRLGAPAVLNPRELWTIAKGAWQEVIDQETFDQAQVRFASQAFHRADTELLCGLRRLLKEQGSLSERLVNGSSYLPSIGPYVRRFGSLSEAFAMVGYIGPKLAAISAKRTGRALRDQVLKKILATTPELISVVQPDGHWRPRLRIAGELVSVYVCRHSNSKSGEARWILNPVVREQRCISLIIRLNPGNESAGDMYVVPDAIGKSRYRLTQDDPWLRRGRQLTFTKDFVSVVEVVNAQRDCRNRTGDEPPIPHLQ
jgi:DNA invertase Pin-like site-specific DNA recombinase